MTLAYLSEETVKAVMRLGADECDVVVAQTNSISVEIEKGSVKQASSSLDPGVGIRAISGGSSGFAFCTTHEPSSIKKAAELAVSLAKSGTADPDFRGLPHASKPKTITGLFDPKVADITPDAGVEMVTRVADIAGDDSRITSVMVGMGMAVCHVSLANSHGLVAEQEMSSFDVFAEAVARSDSTMFSGFDGSSSRRLDLSQLDSAGLSAREHAINGLRQTKIETGDYAIVVDPLAAGIILADAIGGGANAEAVQRGRSYLTGKMGQKIGAESITIVDDPLLKWAVGSTSFDGEGTIARPTTLVDSGRLSSYLHDSYTAGKDSVESTSNSSRGGAVWSYRHPPSISTSNLVVTSGDSSLDEMIKESDRGVYLRVTFDHPNLATGEFSGLMMESYVIEDGALGPSIRQSTVGISLTDLLSRIDLIGRESKDYFGVRTPAFRISNARVAGSA